MFSKIKGLLLPGRARAEQYSLSSTASEDAWQEKSAGDPSSRHFPILQRYLQPNSLLTLASATRSLLDKLPRNDPNSYEIYCFGALCLDLAAQILYHDVAQFKLVGLFQQLGSYSTFFQSDFNESRKRGQCWTFQRLKEKVRDDVQGPWVELPPMEYVNTMAFVARLCQRQVLAYGTSCAVPAMLDAFAKPDDPLRAVSVLAAAQWVLWYGQTLFAHVIQGKPDDDEIATEDYHPCEPFNLDRWHYWRDGFKQMAVEGPGEEGPALNEEEGTEKRDSASNGANPDSNVSNQDCGLEIEIWYETHPVEWAEFVGECRSVCLRVVDLMNSLERT